MSDTVGEAAGRTVRTETDGSPLTPEQIADALRQQSPGGGERRTGGERYAWTHEIHLQVMEQGLFLESRSLHARGIDLSKTGLSVAVQRFLVPGTLLRAKISLSDCSLLITGVVRHCTLIRGRDYHVGVEFQSAVRRAYGARGNADATNS